jgi:tetratricopeptide (TPR) repeat protein
MLDRITDLLTRHLCTALAACLLLPACAYQSLSTHNTIPALEGLPPYVAEDIDPLHISDEMRQFLEEYIPVHSNSNEMAFNLAWVIRDPWILEFDYDPSITLSAEETFRQMTGNCLSFSSLVIALARERGLEAWYQEVEVPRQWSAVNETILVGKHVNAVILGQKSRYSRSEYTIDVSREDLGEEPNSRRLSDDEARAQFYNNLGVDALLENNLPKSYAYLSKALEVDPATPYIWSNLGVVFKRNNQLDAAKQVYLAALNVNPGEIVALTNLYTLYDEEGDAEAASKMQSRVERYRRRNPYYLDHLSGEAIGEQRYEDAIKLARKAIKIDDTEYRFHMTLALSLFLKGDENAASSSLDRAKELAPDDTGLNSISLTQLAEEFDI